MLPIVDYEAST
jgi:ribonuclease HI